MLEIRVKLSSWIRIIFTWSYNHSSNNQFDFWLNVLFHRIRKVII